MGKRSISSRVCFWKDALRNLFCTFYRTQQRMGCTSSNTRLTVATLNFSGICLSPFEYHDCTIEKDYMSTLFEKVLKAEFKDKNFQGWEAGRIDQKFQKERYTPIYRSQAGVEQGKLLDRADFEFYWGEYFKRIDKTELQEIEATEEQIAHVKVFDWLCYLTLLHLVYNEGPSHEFDLATVKEISPDNYLKFLMRYHSKAYLNNQKKMRKVADLIKNGPIDVLFLQEARVSERVTWRDLLPKQTFQLVDTKKGDSMIIYKHHSFPQEIQNANFLGKYDLNFNEDSAIAIAGQFLLLSVHLSSKAIKNKQQVQKMLETLRLLQKEHPHVKIIAGIDANQYIPHESCSTFSIYPREESTTTTAKKRTFMQLQSKKANVIVIETKDHILTSEKLSEGTVGTLVGKIDMRVFLPTDEHPFDYYLLTAVVR